MAGKGGVAKRGVGDKMHRVMVKLKALRYPLQQLNRVQFSGVLDQVSKARVELSTHPEQLSKDPWNTNLIQQEEEYRQHYLVLTKASHAFMIQKSKATWL